MQADENKTTPWEEVGRAMREYVLVIHGRQPTQEEFERMYFAWYDEMKRIYDN
jgi:hypothetical protein